jgi:anti-sigma regulatory factor (Ser/Thr protein kinase)
LLVPWFGKDGDTMIPFRAEIVADPVELAGLRQQFEGWLQGAGVPDADVVDLVIALNEAVANAVEHGSPSDFVNIRAELVHGSVSIGVADTGRWKERGLVPDSEGRGRGLMIIRALVEDVGVRCSGEGTTVTMRRRVGLAA